MLVALAAEALGEPLVESVGALAEVAGLSAPARFSARAPAPAVAPAGAGYRRGEVTLSGGHPYVLMPGGTPHRKGATSVVDCISCKGSRSCVRCLGTGFIHGADAMVRCERCLGSGKCAVCQQIRLLDLVTRPEALPRGVVKEDMQVHAVRRWVGGDQALCGAGPIARRLSGDFEPGAPGTCGDCGYHAGR